MMDFIDLHRQQAKIRGQIERRIHTILDHGHYIMGPEVAELEERLCAFSGARYCISCASGTDALLLPLMAWGVGSGDAVFVPPFTFFATAEEPAFLGATPVFVDVDGDNRNMRPDHLEKAILAVLKQDPDLYPLPKAALCQKLTPKVIIPVDLFGQPAQYEAILPIAEKYGLRVLEDAAQAFGAERNGRKTCALGAHAAATSFFPAKPLGCYGDGGAVFTDDEELAGLLRSIRIHGKGNDKYDNVRIGCNGRLDTFQAAILLEKLEIFPEEIAARQEVASWYATHLAPFEQIVTPKLDSCVQSVWAQYCILVPAEARSSIMQSLRDRGVPTNVYYPKPLHCLTVFEHLGYTPADMPTALHLSSHILALPFHPYMQETDVATVAQTLSEAFS